MGGGGVSPRSFATLAHHHCFLLVPYMPTVRTPFDPARQGPRIT